jgi:hypothetical protein
VFSKKCWRERGGKGGGGEEEGKRRRGGRGEEERETHFFTSVNHGVKLFHEKNPEQKIS